MFKYIGLWCQIHIHICMYVGLKCKDTFWTSVIYTWRSICHFCIWRFKFSCLFHSECSLFAFFIEDGLGIFLVFILKRSLNILSTNILFVIIFKWKGSMLQSKQSAWLFFTVLLILVSLNWRCCLTSFCFTALSHIRFTSYVMAEPNVHRFASVAIYWHLMEL